MNLIASMEGGGGVILGGAGGLSGLITSSSDANVMIREQHLVVNIAWFMIIFWVDVCSL